MGNRKSETTGSAVWRRSTAALMALALLAGAACGDDSDDGAGGAATTQPVETTATDGTETTEGGAETTEGGAETTEPSSSDDPLGPIDQAEGEPVKVGFIYDGQSVSTDASYQEGAAEAMVAYINERRG